MAAVSGPRVVDFATHSLTQQDRDQRLKVVCLLNASVDRSQLAAQVTAACTLKKQNSEASLAQSVNRWNSITYCPNACHEYLKQQSPRLQTLVTYCPTGLSCPYAHSVAELFAGRLILLTLGSHRERATALTFKTQACIDSACAVLSCPNVHHCINEIPQEQSASPSLQPQDAQQLLDQSHQPLPRPQSPSVAPLDDLLPWAQTDAPPSWHDSSWPLH